MGRSRSIANSISSSRFHDSLTFYYGLVCLVSHILDLSEAFRIPAQVTSQMYVQLFTYHFAHRDTQHIAGNIGTILLLGPHLEVLMGKEKFWAMSALTVVSGGFAGIFLEAGMQGSSGLLIAYALIYLRFSDSSGIKNKRKSRDTIDLSVLLVVILSFARVFWEYSESDSRFNETNSEFAHICAGITGAVVYPQIFGPYKDRLRSSSFHISSPFKKPKKKEEAEGFGVGLRNIFRRRNDSESESESEDDGKKGLLSRFRKKKKKQKKDEYDSDSSDDGNKKRRSKGIYSNIPKEKLRGNRRFNDESDSDYSN